MEINKDVYEAIDNLIDVTYDTGYYSGIRADGQTQHVMAIHNRDKAKAFLIVLIERQLEEANAAGAKGNATQIDSVLGW